MVDYDRDLPLCKEPTVFGECLGGEQCHRETVEAHGLVEPDTYVALFGLVGGGEQVDLLGFDRDTLQGQPADIAGELDRLVETVGEPHPEVAFEETFFAVDQ